jgi:hypothetical protein
MNALDKYQRILASKGVALNGLGLSEIALRRSDAMGAIEALRESSVPILGGDVYSEKAGTIEPAYANWHVDRDAGERETEFAIRSCVKAESYVEKYPRRAGEEPLFVLVVRGFKMAP